MRSSVRRSFAVFFSHSRLGRAGMGLGLSINTFFLAPVVRDIGQKKMWFEALSQGGFNPSRGPCAALPARTSSTHERFGSSASLSHRLTVRGPRVLLRLR